MTLNECYCAFGGNLQDLLQRLPSERLVVKLLRKFPEDPSFRQLTAALEENDLDTAFRGAHSLKGLCMNLGFDRLLRSSSALTEALRPGTAFNEAAVRSLLEQVRNHYAQVCETIARLDA